VRSIGKQIGIGEAVALDPFPDMDGDGCGEHRSGGDRRMELAVFPARVDAGGKTTQEGSVERSPGIAPVEPSEVDADKMRNNSAGDHVTGQRTRVPPPEREQPLHAGARQQAFSIGPDVLEEQIAEDDMFNAPSLYAGACFRKSGFVSFIGARVWKFYTDERKSKRGCLSRQQNRSHAMHGDAVIGCVNRRDDPDNFCYTLTSRFEDRVGAILAGAPGDERLGRADNHALCFSL
jgi:hypothetical protein